MMKSSNNACIVISEARLPFTNNHLSTPLDLFAEPICISAVLYSDKKLENDMMTGSNCCILEFLLLKRAKIE